jgi:uncharacterized protein YjbI with pentapeptide repeats
MSEVARSEGDGETPVNPYSLLEAVNHSSDTAHTGWILFLAIMTYFMIAVAGVTHSDLLLRTPVSLPVLQVDIQLAQFFQFAPIVLVLLHMGLISQLTLLARETLEFDRAVRLLELGDKRTHPLRLELNNFFFVQAIAGPHRSAVMSMFLHGMSWLTLVILPVILILFIQLSFLPYHDTTITWTHRLALLADIILLVSIGIFLTRSETSFYQAFVRSSSSHPVTFMLTAIVLAVVGAFSLFLATVPGERLDRIAQSALGHAAEFTDGAPKTYVSGFALPFLNSGSDGALFGIFRRNLVVTDTDLARTRNGGEDALLALRNRDLRYARLDRSLLQGADFTGSDLEGASFVGADLSGAKLQCADLTEYLLSGNRQLARCVRASGATFKRARLENAELSGIDLTGANLEEVKAEGAVLTYAILAGANLSSAVLDKADLTGGVQAQGASFLLASLQGADLTGAQLQFADLSSTSLQGALLSYANLHGANLNDADLEAASLQQARLYGADLTGASIVAADLRGAGVWATAPPQTDATGLADFADLNLKPLEPSEEANLRRVLDGVRDQTQRARGADTLQQLFGEQPIKTWSDSTAGAKWQTFRSPIGGSSVGAAPFTDRLNAHLARAMCKARWSNGAVATGIARRAKTHGFKGDLVYLFEALKSEDCPAAKTMLPTVYKDFSFAADVARSE